ncbi:MAG: hypothetical protein P8J33_14805, partial [Pirellulaceae bacterium]|nr:hypothetical protein [Pirellulaceae bacterium]
MIRKIVQGCLFAALCLSASGLAAQNSDDVLPKDQLTRYRSVKLTADLEHLNDNQKKMLGHLIEAAKKMDECFWYQALGDSDQFEITD